MKLQFSFHCWQSFSLSTMATLRNKRKLAAVSRETPESTRNSRAQNTLGPDLAQDYISQVSEEIEGRVTKKLSKEFSRTESRILGALSKLDEFLLNPQVRTCSVAVPGNSRNSNSENREPTGDHSLNDPCPEVAYSSHHSGHLPSSEVEEYPHRFLGRCWVGSQQISFLKNGTQCWWEKFIVLNKTIGFELQKWPRIKLALQCLSRMFQCYQFRDQ